MLPVTHESPRHPYVSTIQSHKTTLARKSRRCTRVHAAAVDDDESDENNNGTTRTRNRSESLRRAKRKHTRSFKPAIHSLLFNSRLSLILLALLTFILGVAADSGRRNALVVGEDVEILRDRRVLVGRSATPVEADLPSKRSTSQTSISTANAETGISDITATAFDSVSLTNNLTSDCSQFLTFITANNEFKNCLPLSGLLRDSTSFFDIMNQGAFQTTAIMDRMCAVNFTGCANFMDNYSGQIRQDRFCHSDYESMNPVVMDMYTTLIAYRPLYSAGCLKAKNGDYCFVDAVTDTQNHDDLYIYSLPLGTHLPASSRFTCNDCLKRTVSIFSIPAGNTTQLLSDTYKSAAELINSGCGANFTNTTVEPLQSGGSFPSSSLVSSFLAALAVVAAASFL
ncbi:hypothetical protein BDD12DRAFT_875591 [Trichophaea hybrida]|nr:hypothetical protein BDD12DRAFT_875591 [Trichophaea hybrida]